MKNNVANSQNNDKNESKFEDHFRNNYSATEGKLVENDKGSQQLIEKHLVVKKNLK